MKCCDIHAGKLTAEIVIERNTKTPDGAGGNTDAWATIDTVWAMWRGLGGSERWAAMRVSTSNRFKAVVPFRDDGNGAPYYSGKDRIKYNGRTYAIEYVMDMEDRRQWIEIGLTEGESS